MPNWCNNTLILEGTTDELQKVKPLLFNGEDKFSLACAVPPPKDLEDWYNWNISNWGTKWDTFESYSDITEGEIRINFSTAWSPPIEWLSSFFRKIEGAQISVELLFDEPGMSFAGSTVRDSDGNVNEYEGRIYNVDYNDNEVFYDSNMNRYRNAKGQFVNEDEITYEADYGN